MRTVLFGAVTYAFTFVGVNLLLAGINVFQRREGSVNASDNFLMPAYLVLAAGALSTLGFALVTACSSSWRQQTVRAAVLISGPLSVLALLLQLTGLGSLPVLILLPSSLLRAWPRAGATVFFAFPGILAGLVAVFVAWIRSSRQVATDPE
jgi:hypothetical protein